MARHRAVVLALFGVLAIVHSWPLASDLAHLSRLDNDDAALNTWTVAWTAHILPIAPWRLFEAPIFYPEAHTLAYTDLILVPSLMGAPLLWLGSSPVAVHSFLIILGLGLSGFAMSQVIAKWTGSRNAGIVAGMLYGFNAHVLMRFAHLQAQHAEFFPIMLYALDRVLERNTAGDRWLLAGAFTLQSLCSNHFLVFCTFALIVAAAVRGNEWLAPGRRPAMGGLVIAGLISVVAVGPFLWPYYRVRTDQGLVRSVGEVALYSAHWQDYLATGANIHYQWWSHAFTNSSAALFPGFVGLALAAVAFRSGQAWRDRRARMALAFGIVGFCFSFGPAFPGNGPYVLNNTRYFKPLINGYSGFEPRTFSERAQTLETFPSIEAFTTLKSLGVTHVTVHLAAFRQRSGADALEAIEHRPELQLLADEGGIRLYGVR